MRFGTAQGISKQIQIDNLGGEDFGIGESSRTTSS
jgi:hypothetical protein